MSYQKLNSAKNKDNDLSQLTQIDFILIITAGLVMIIIGLRHINDVDEFGVEWSNFALLQAAFAFLGLFGSQIISNKPLIPKSFKSINLNTLLYAAIILIASELTQIITQYTFSVSNSEKAVYYVFAAVAEESFFRLFLINLFLKIFGTELYSKIISVLLSAVLFAAIHQNYYNNIQMLLGVFFGGIVLGTSYILTKNITSNIFAHFLLNLLAVGSLLVVL